MPILHLSQLIGVAAGFEDSELKFKRHVVSVDAAPSRSSKSEPAWIAVVLGAIALAGLVWGWFEAGWVRLRDARGRGAGVAGRARRPADRASLGLPPRRAVARGAGRRARRRVGARARPRSRLRHRRPRVAPTRARRGCARSCRLPRCYAILGNHDFAISRDPFSKAVELREARAGDAAARRGPDARVRGVRVWIAGARSRARAAREPDAASTKRPHDPALPTSRRVLDRLAAEGSTSCSRATCTTARSASRIRAESCGSRIPARYTHGLYRHTGR